MLFRTFAVVAALLLSACPKVDADGPNSTGSNSKESLPASCANCKVADCFADAPIVGDWECDTNGGTVVEVDGPRIYETNALGQEGCGCITCGGMFELVSLIDNGVVNTNGVLAVDDKDPDAATLDWEYCVSSLEACRKTGGTHAGPFKCKRMP